MKKIHEHLVGKHNWYANWHRHPHHVKVHLLVLFVVLIMLFVSINAAAKLEITDTSVKELRLGGFLPDDPEKVKKVPRLVALGKEKRNDQKYLESITPSGESLVTMATLASLPSSISLIAPVPGDQGGEGSCVAFAVSHARTIEEYYVKNATSYNKAINIFSPEYLYNQSSISNMCSSGSAFQPNLDVLASQGVSTWQSMPYSSWNGCGTFPNTSQLAEASNFKIASYSRILTSDKTTIKTMLATNHPVIINVSADNSFINAGPDFIWKIKTSGTLPHAIIIVGYDDSKNAYKVMNSWGATWGDGGFSWIDYDFFLTVTGYYAYSMNVIPTTDMIPPTVALTSPVINTITNSIVNLSANASDSNGVASVFFRINGKTMGLGFEDNTAPYNATLNAGALSTGTHTITAVARDSSGNITVSSPVSLTVTSGDTILPAVSFSSPASGTIVSGDVKLFANASDNGGIAKVSFKYRPEASTSMFVLGEDTEAPFDIIWRQPGYYAMRNGTYYFYAIAEDFAGNIVTTTPITLILNNLINARVEIYTDSANMIWSGQFESDTQIEYGTTPSYGSSTVYDPTLIVYHKVPIRGLSPGTKYYYKAKSKDATGVIMTSQEGLNFITRDTSDTSPPTISLTSPANGTTLSGVTIISATATDNVVIDHIDFYRGTILIGADATAPYSIDWDTTQTTNGSHSISARAYDAAGNSTASSSVLVTVSNTVTPPPDTTVPTVSITAPLNGSTIAGTTTISASATDNIGVTKVDFYRGTTLFGTDTTSPYSISWNTTTVANSTYSLTAKAYDASGNTATSSIVSVSIANIATPPPPADTTLPVVSISSPLNNAIVSGTRTINASASDNSGSISKMEIYVDNILLKQNTLTASISYRWNTRKISIGSHTIVVKAYDAAGNVGEASITVYK